MKISFSQIYIEHDATYPFSTKFQIYLSSETSKLGLRSDYFDQKFGQGFHLIFRISAKKDLSTAEKRGPTVFKRDKDVEYTLFLPHSGRKVSSLAECSLALHHLINAVAKVLESLGVDTHTLEAAAPGWISHVLSKPEFYLERDSGLTTTPR